MGQIKDLRNQVQVEAALEANHMSCYVEKKLRKENMQKYMLPSATSRLDKVAGTFEALKTFEVPQNQFIGKVAECTPVDSVPVMAGRLDQTVTSFCSLNWKHVFFCFFLRGNVALSVIWKMKHPTRVLKLKHEF